MCTPLPSPALPPSPPTRPQKGTVRVLLPGIITQNLEKVFKVWQEGWGWNVRRVRACVRCVAHACASRVYVSVRVSPYGRVGDRRASESGRFSAGRPESPAEGGGGAGAGAGRRAGQPAASTRRHRFPAGAPLTFAQPPLRFARLMEILC